MLGQEKIREREAFVGRRRELAGLKAGADEALAGHGCFFTLSGEPGVGKTRVAQETASYMEARGGLVIWGRCWDHGGAPAYWPWIQVIRALADIAEPATLATWLGSGAADIAQIAPELRDRLGGLPTLPSAQLVQPEMARFRLFDSVVAFLRRAAEAQPLLIVLDDLHAADPTTLMLLVALARQIRGMRAAVVGTYREVEVRHQTELATLISAAEREGTVFPLRGFGPIDIREFLERAWGVSAAKALVDQLSEITEGNLFFLHEVVRQITADGPIERNAPINRRRLGVTRGVSDFIKNLARPLPEGTRKALDLASVIGREFTLDTLAAASALSAEELESHLEHAISLELVDELPPGRYSFRHALIREALYEGLSRTSRRSMHRAIAGAIRSLRPKPEPSAQIAYHYCQASSGEDAELAIEYSRQAAREAEKQLAYEEAASHLRNAIEAVPLAHSDRDLLQAELLCELGEAQAKSGEHAEARKTCLEAADIARRIDNDPLFARAVVTAGRRMSNSGVTDHELVALLNEGLERLGDQESPQRAQMIARLGLELYWSDRKRAVQLSHQAVDMSRRLNHARTMAVALWGRHLALRNPDSLEQRLADGREAIAVAESAGERDFALEARFFRMSDLVESGDIEAFDAALVEYLKAEAQLRDRFKRGLLLQGMRAQMDGRIQQSQALAQQAFAAGQQSGRPLALNAFLVQHGMGLWELGRFSELEAPLKGFIAQNPLIVFARCAFLLILMELRRWEEARTEFRLLAGEEFGRLQRDWNWLPAMFVLSDVCAELQDEAIAPVLYRLLAPYAARNAVLGGVYTYGSVSLELGKLAALMGHVEQAEAHLMTALAANQRIRANVWAAHAQAELAGVLWKRAGPSDADQASRLISPARLMAEASGSVRLQRKLERLVAGGQDAPAPDKAGSVRAVIPGDLQTGAHALEALAASAIAQVQDLAAFASREGAVAILFSDLEASSVLYDTLGDRRALDLVRVHNELFRQEVEVHRGHEVKSLGDGFMVAFSSPHRAAQCAVAVQKSFQAFCERHPDTPMRVRIGLHVGEAINEASDLFGRTIIVASRIAAVAEGGRICVSSEMQRVLSATDEFRFKMLGEKPLKGLTGLHEIYELEWRAEG